jgi:heme-degrading monooxygenase HmoA
VYVAISEISVPESGAAGLVEAFRQRLRAVDSFEGFLGLEVLRDRRDASRFLMLTRWRSRELFLAYMRSQAHRESHSRIAKGPGAPRPAGFSDYELVAE